VFSYRKVCICISFITSFPDPWDREEVDWIQHGFTSAPTQYRLYGRQGGGDRRLGHSRRDRDAGTNVTKLPGLTSYMNSHSQTPGQRVDRDTHAGTYGHRNHVASYNMTDFDYDNREQKTTTLDVQRRTSPVSSVIVVDDDVPVP